MSQEVISKLGFCKWLLHKLDRIVLLSQKFYANLSSQATRIEKHCNRQQIHIEMFGLWRIILVYSQLPFTTGTEDIVIVFVNYMPFYRSYIRHFCYLKMTDDARTRIFCYNQQNNT